MGCAGEAPKGDEEEAEAEAEAEAEDDAPPDGGCASLWDKCGGEGWTGSSCCPVGSVCRAQSQWYSQCVPEGSSPMALADRHHDSSRGAKESKLRGQRGHRHHSMMMVQMKCQVRKPIRRSCDRCSSRSRLI